MYSCRDMLAFAMIWAALVIAAAFVSLCTGCAAYQTMPDRAQVMCINEFRRSVGLDTLSMEDLK